MVFIDLENAYDKVTKEVIWWVLTKQRVSHKYINIVQDMYKRAKTYV